MFGEESKENGLATHSKHAPSPRPMSFEEHETAKDFEIALLEFSLSCRIAAPCLTDVVLKLGEKAYVAAGSPFVTQVAEKAQVPADVNVSVTELIQVGFKAVIFLFVFLNFSA